MYILAIALTAISSSSDEAKCQTCADWYDCTRSKCGGRVVHYSNDVAIQEDGPVNGGSDIYIFVLT